MTSQYFPERFDDNFNKLTYYILISNNLCSEIKQEAIEETESAPYKVIILDKSEGRKFYNMEQRSPFIIFQNNLRKQFNIKNAKASNVLKTKFKQDTFDEFHFSLNPMFKEFNIRTIETNIISKSPKKENFQYYFFLGLVNSIKKDYEDALKDYDKAIELNPNYPEAYNNRGSLKFYLSDHVGALMDFDKAIALDPDCSEAYNNRGRLKSYLRDYEGALMDFDKAIALNPDNPEAYNNRGKLKSDSGDYEDALMDFTKAIELKSDYYNAYHNRAKCYRKLAEKEKYLNRKSDIIDNAIADEHTADLLEYEGFELVT